MISHPFEIKPSASGARPDVLRVNWRNTPAQSTCQIYLPAVQAQAVIGLADTLYGRHRLSAIDANTLQFPASDLTLIPIPAGSGRLAGLLSIDVRPSLPQGQSCVVSVRQLSSASATSVSRPAPPPPPPPPRINVDLAFGEDNFQEAASIGPARETFFWHNAQGAFQVTITSESDKLLLAGQERLLAWLKWRIGVTPAQSRWLPVFQRYLTYTEKLIWSLGKDPGQIPPSEVGNVGGVGGQGSGSGPCPGGGHKPPACPPCETRGHEHEHECTGKIVAIDYDRFGDFRGFVILTEAGFERAFRATEPAIEHLVREAWEARTVVSAFSEPHEHERLDRLVLRRYR